MNALCLRNRYFALWFAALAAWMCVTASAIAENCVTSNDMDPATKSVMLAAGQRYFDLLGRGDANSLRQASIPSLVADFAAIETAVKDNQPALAGAKAAPRPAFLLEAQGAQPSSSGRAEFFCGVFGANGQTRDSAIFTLGSLPAGKYGVVILDVSGGTKGAYTVSLILQLIGNDWKLGGLYIKSAQTGGHDLDWFVARAHDYQSKGQAHNAWLYYLEARSLVSPLPFMSTAVTDKLYDESQKAQPADFPSDGKTLDLAAGTATYKLTELFPEVVGDDLDLIAKYQIASIADTNQVYGSNVVVMKALVAKYPELRGAFAGVVARGVDPGGHDYGTLLAMKDIK
jgi:hypothetical protein